MDAAPDSGRPSPEKEPPGQVYLLAGDWVVSSNPVRATTILGSCVAVCLWDPRRRIGGLNHFVLPHGGSESVGRPMRFGDLALPRLLRGMTDAGSRTRDIKAKVFGGACMSQANTARSVGRKNVLLAYEFLAAHAISVVGEDIGGNRGRKLVFFTGDGAAFVKEL